MPIVIVPTELSEAIHAKIDEQLLHCPEAKPHREEIYHRLLRYFDEHGEVPAFTLQSPQAERTES